MLERGPGAQVAEPVNQLRADYHTKHISTRKPIRDPNRRPVSVLLV